MVQFFQELRAGRLQQGCDISTSSLALSLCGQAGRRPRNPKHQAPSSKETPSSKHRAPGLGAWDLELLWSLVLGVWSFLVSCCDAREIIEECPVRSLRKYRAR